MERRVTVKASVKLTQPKKPSTYVTCVICGVNVLAEHTFVSYPCSKRHKFHLVCLYSKEDMKDCLEACPACVDPQATLCQIEDSHECLQNVHKNVKRSLNVGRKLQTVLDEIRIDVIQDISRSKYKQRTRDYEALTEGHEPHPAGYLSSLFGWRTRQTPTEFQDIGYSGSVNMILKSRENSAVMALKRITWSSMIQENIDIHTFFSYGYVILDCFVLGASWEDLISSGLRHYTFLDYPKSIDMGSLIDYYGLTFYQIYSELCFYDMDNMADLGLTYDDYVSMGFTLRSLIKREMGPINIIKSRLWKTMLEEQWQKLKIFKPREEIELEE